MQSTSKSFLRRLQSGKLQTASLILFLRQLTVLSAGLIPLDRAMEILSESAPNTPVRNTADELAQHMREGAMLSDAMRASGLFPALLLAMIETGEESGTLSEVLKMYTQSLERQDATRKKVQQSLLYPIFLTVISVAVVTFLLLFVIPSFVRLFSDAGMLLPLPTRILLSISTLLTTYGGWLLLIPILLGAASVFLFFHPAGRIRLHRIRRSIPFFGRLSRDMDTARMAELMALYTASNVDFVRFVSILAGGSTRLAEKDALEGIHDRLLQGDSVSYAFAKADFYNPVFISMLRTGEEAGQLTETVSSIASYLNLEIELRLRRATSLVEPVLILVLSFLVGFIVLAIAMPMFQMVNLYDL